MIHVYNIATWNANGLLQRVKAVEVFLNTQKIDILLVSETHFTEQNYVNIRNYITYATNHPDGRAHASSAIIIRKDIKHHELVKYEMDHIRATNTSIEDWDGNLTISAIYCPHATKFKWNNTMSSLTH
jgi:exonuclease III